MKTFLAPSHALRPDDAIGPIAVSPTDAARIAGVGRTTIYAALGSGALRSSKIGARRLITISALQEWLDAMETPVEGYEDARR